MEAGRLLWLGCIPAHAVSRQHVGHVILAIDGHGALLCFAMPCLLCYDRQCVAFLAAPLALEKRVVNSSK